MDYSDKYRYAHIIPVGTSLLANYQRDHLDRVEELGLKGWDRLGPEDPVQNEICEKMSKLLRELKKYIDNKGYGASAELTPLKKAIETFGHRVEETLIILYSTNTCNSKLARGAIARFLRDKGFNVAEEELKGIRSVDEMDIGLAELLDKVVSKIDQLKSRGVTVYINASPGFKAEAAFLVIASLTHCVDVVYYMHESFRELVTLPTPPLTIENRYMNILERFKEPLNPSEAEEEAGSGEMLRELEIRGLIHRDEKGNYKLRQWIRRMMDKKQC